MAQSSKLTVHARQFNSKDVPSLAELLVLTPDDGSQYRFPHIREHPDEMHSLHCGWLYPAVHDSQTLVRVAVIETNGQEKVVGFSSWTQHEYDPESLEKRTRLRKMLDWTTPEPDDQDKPIIPAPEGLSKAFVADKTRSEAFKKARKRAELVKQQEDVPRLELNGLATHPEYQGHGIATDLVNWGLTKAAESGIPVYVTGESTGVAFYKKRGFRPVPGTEFWLDKDGRDLTAEQLKEGNTTGTKAEGGVSAAQLIWSHQSSESKD